MFLYVSVWWSVCLLIWVIAQSSFLSLSWVKVVCIESVCQKLVLCLCHRFIYACLCLAISAHVYSSVSLSICSFVSFFFSAFQCSLSNIFYVVFVFWQSHFLVNIYIIIFVSFDIHVHVCMACCLWQYLFLFLSLCHGLCLSVNV